jgi:hypothetical protein
VAVAVIVFIRSGEEGGDDEITFSDSGSVSGSGFGETGSDTDGEASNVETPVKLFSYTKHHK